jgi:hypothetical protein
MTQAILIVCALINVAIAALHIYIIFDGAPSYRHFGAGEWMATQAEQGSLIPAVITWGVTAVFFCFALYNLVAANAVALPLPWLFYGLVAVAAIYILRGSVVITFPFMSNKITAFEKGSSYIALAIGILQAAGTYLYYQMGK